MLCLLKCRAGKSAACQAEETRPASVVAGFYQTADTEKIVKIKIDPSLWWPVGCVILHDVGK